MTIVATGTADEMRFSFMDVREGDFSAVYRVSVQTVLSSMQWSINGNFWHQPDLIQ